MAVQQILVIEHATYQRGFYQVILDWVKAHVPECSACFDLQVLSEHLAPCPTTRWWFPGCRTRCRPGLPKRTGKPWP